jgi:hypothetical protein
MLYFLGMVTRKNAMLGNCVPYLIALKDKKGFAVTVVGTKMTRPIAITSAPEKCAAMCRSISAKAKKMNERGYLFWFECDTFGTSMGRALFAGDTHDFMTDDVEPQAQLLSEMMSGEQFSVYATGQKIVRLPQHVREKEK